MSMRSNVYGYLALALGLDTFSRSTAIHPWLRAAHLPNARAIVAGLRGAVLASGVPIASGSWLIPVSMERLLACSMPVLASQSQVSHQFDRQCPPELRCKHGLQKTSPLGGGLFSLKS